MAERDTVVHIERPCQDLERLAGFCTGAFGRKRKNPGEEMGFQVTAASAETDMNNMVKRPGAINGGSYPGNLRRFPASGSFCHSPIPSETGRACRDRGR